MAVSPLLAPGALAAYTGLSAGQHPPASPYRVQRDRVEDQVTISDEAKRLSKSPPADRAKIPDDFDLRTLTQKLAQGKQVRDFLTRAFQSNL